MRKIIIRNIGAIANIEIDFNRINVIIGPQSSGKSTVAKIISYCQWVEKRRIMDGKYNEDVSQQLLNFHRLDKNYFNGNSFFEYESDFIKITYEGKELKESILIKNETEYEKSKNIYIPSERNFVSTIPNLGKYNETNDNIMSFVYDWYTAKRKFTKENPAPILNLGVDFYNIQNSDSDILILNENNKEIPLNTGSSGLQSVIPLVLITEYLTDIYYKENNHPLSVNEQLHLDELISYHSGEISILTNRRKSYYRTNFIIEEPEQNLFPITQRDLTYFILNKMKSEKNHSLLLTTHSPYILYALNNCMMAGIVFDKVSEKNKQKLRSELTPINPETVSIYQINKGELKCIQQNDGLIGDNYFDNNMKELMDDFYILLNYYK
jgi:predicted ATPase